MTVVQSNSTNIKNKPWIKHRGKKKNKLVSRDSNKRASMLRKERYNRSSETIPEEKRLYLYLPFVLSPTFAVGVSCDLFLVYTTQGFLGRELWRTKSRPDCTSTWCSSETKRSLRLSHSIVYSVFCVSDSSWVFVHPSTFAFPPRCYTFTMEAQSSDSERSSSAQNVMETFLSGFG